MGRRSRGAATPDAPQSQGGSTPWDTSYKVAGGNKVSLRVYLWRARTRLLLGWQRDQILHWLI